MEHFSHLIPLPHTLASHTTHVDGVTKCDDLNSCGLSPVDAESPSVAEMSST